MGGDPRYRKSTYCSILLHVVVLIVLPLLLGRAKRVMSTLYPVDNTQPALMPVVIVGVRRARPRDDRKRVIVDTGMDCIECFHSLNVDKLLACFEAYDKNRGRGECRSDVDWPMGLDFHIVRFVRLQYVGHGWDDGMRSTRADRNLLEYLESRLPPHIEVALSGEHLPIAEIGGWRAGPARPYVYMTGDDGIQVTNRERNALRAYLLNGGMLFADCGGADWNRSFREFVGALLPDHTLKPIPHDAPLFREPFAFPNGAPPLWGHGGTDALGIKHEGRWIVFYHPGDMNDAWKMGRGGLEECEAQTSFEMALNVVYYAIKKHFEPVDERREP